MAPPARGYVLPKTPLAKFIVAKLGREFDQEEMANRLGVTPGFLWQVLQADKPLALARIDDLAAILGVAPGTPERAALQEAAEATYAARKRVGGGAAYTKRLEDRVKVLEAKAAALSAKLAERDRTIADQGRLIAALKRRAIDIPE